jgi:hypothetical protein
MLASAAWDHSVLRLVFAHVEAALYYDRLPLHKLPITLPKQIWLPLVRAPLVF